MIQTKAKYKHLLLLLSFSLVSSAYAQDNNSYQIKLASEAMATAKLYESKNADSATLYRESIVKSLNHYQQASVTAYHAYGYLLLGINWLEQGQYDSTIYYLRKSLGSYQPNATISRAEILSNVYTFMTHSFKALGMRDSAVHYGLKLVTLARQQNDSVTEANYLYTVGTIYGGYHIR